MASLEAEGVLRGDLSYKSLSWASDLRRPIWFVRGKDVTLYQAESVIRYHEHMEQCSGYFPTPLWCHPDGVIGYQDSGFRYPDMESYYRQWAPIAQSFPFLDLIFITFRIEEAILEEEWDIFEQLITEMPNELLERHIDRTKTVTLVSFRELLLEKVSGYKLRNTLRGDVDFSLDLQLSGIMTEYYSFFELAKLSLQPERLKKYFSVALLVKNGTVEILTDPEDIYRAYFPYTSYDFDQLSGIKHDRAVGVFSKYTQRF